MGARARLNDLKEFFSRTTRNYRMMIVRSGGSFFFTNLTSNYTTIFTKALGADNRTIGYLTSLSAFISMIISMPVGWMADNYNLKKVIGAGMFLHVTMIGMYAFAQNWYWILGAMVINPFTMSLMFRSQQIIITNELQPKDRSTGLGFRMVIAQFLGLISPIPAALMVDYFGGLTVEGIRPLFYMRLVGTLLVYAYVYFMLLDTVPNMRLDDGVSFVEDMMEVMKGGRKLRVMILVAALGALVWSIMESFVWLYAAEVKGGDELTLGLMSTVSTISAILFTVPVNRISDTRGRKVAFILTRPALWLSFVIMVYANHQYWLLVAWFFRGIAMSSNAYQLLNLELVPAEQRGRWLGISNTFSASVRIFGPILGGYLYDSSYPALIFVIPLIIDMVIRIPIMQVMLPETLVKEPVTS